MPFLKQFSLKRFLVPALFYSAVCAFGVLTMFYPTLLSGFSRSQDFPIDSRINHYFLEHSFQFIFNKNYTITDFWSPSFFYPFKNALALSDNLLGAAPLYWLLRAFTPLDVAFDLWMIGVSVLNFVCFAILLRRFRIHPILIAFGSFFFAFGMPRVSLIGHQQLLPQFFMPIAFLFLWNLIHCPRVIYFALFLLFTYLQILAGIYLGWFWLLGLLILCPVIFFSIHQETKANLIRFFKRKRIAIALIFLVWLICLIWLFYPYVKAKEIVGDRSYDFVEKSLPRLSSWLLPPIGSFWSKYLGTLVFPSGEALFENSASITLPFPWENQLFPGAIVILLTGFSIYYIFRKSDNLTDRKILAKVSLTTALIIFVISFNFSSIDLSERNTCIYLVKSPITLQGKRSDIAIWGKNNQQDYQLIYNCDQLNSYSPWRVVYSILPGASAIRFVSRIGLLFYFFLLIGILLCVDAALKTEISTERNLQGTISSRLKFVIVSFICILGILEQVNFDLQSYPKAPLLAAEAELKELMSQQCDVVYGRVENPSPMEELWLSDGQNVSLMLAGIQAGVPVVNGYSGWSPPKLPNPLKSATLAEIYQWLGDRFQGNLCMIAPTQSLASQSEFELIAQSFSAIQTNSTQHFTLLKVLFPLPEQDHFSQEIQPVNLPSRVLANTEIQIPVVVKNTSKAIWLTDGEKPIRFSYRWLDTQGQIINHDSQRTSLPFPVMPGASVALNSTIQTPEQSGKYTLQLTMVYELVAWFSDRGAAAKEIPIIVEARK